MSSVNRIIYFVRHGEREDLLRLQKLNDNEDDEDDGKDLTKRNALLSDLGKTQAFLTGMSIAQNLRPRLMSGAKIVVMSSPYLRCMQTAFQIILGMKVEGLDLQDMMTLYYTDFLKEYQNQRNSMSKEEMVFEFKSLNLPEAVTIAPGGDQLPIDIVQETPDQSFARTRVFLDKLVQPSLTIGNSSPHVIICVTHSFFFINLYFLHSALMEAYGLIEYCSYARVLVDQNGKTKLDIINHHSHLDKLNLIQKL